jgi:hypothetical protein
MKLSHSFPQFLPAHFEQYIKFVSQLLHGVRGGPATHRFLGLRVRIPPGAWMSVVYVVCCHVEVSATVWSLVRRSPTDCGVPEYNREATEVRRPWPTRGCCAMVKKYQIHYSLPIKLSYSSMLYRVYLNSSSKLSGVVRRSVWAIWEGQHAFRNVYFISKSRLIQSLEPGVWRGRVRNPWAMTSKVIFLNSSFRFHKCSVVCTIFNGKNASNLGRQFAKVATPHSRSTKADQLHVRCLKLSPVFTSL